MDARDVIAILSMFEDAGIEAWVEGGWGIDALLGAQNRDHGDVDLVVDAPRFDDISSILQREGFSVIFEDGPGHYSFQDERGRTVDLSVTVADRYGDRWNVNRRAGRGEPDYPADGFTYGWIAGQKVRCLGPETQIAHHIGYDHEEVDLFDAALLKDRFDVSLPQGLRAGAV